MVFRGPEEEERHGAVGPCPAGRSPACPAAGEPCSDMRRAPLYADHPSAAAGFDAPLDPRPSDRRRGAIRPVASDTARSPDSLFDGRPAAAHTPNPFLWTIHQRPFQLTTPAANRLHVHPGHLGGTEDD